MLMKTEAHFKTLYIAKDFALQNINDKKIMIIQLIDGRYYVKSAETDRDISLITDFLLDYMSDNNCYILGFACNFKGWNSECKLFIDINY